MKVKAICKRLFPLLLAMVMLIGALPLPSLAADTGETGSHTTTTFFTVPGNEGAVFATTWNCEVDVPCTSCGVPNAAEIRMQDAEITGYTVSPESAVTDFKMTRRIDDGDVKYDIEGTGEKPGEATITVSFVCEWDELAHYHYTCEACGAKFEDVPARDMPQTGTLIIPVTISRKYTIGYDDNGGENGPYAESKYRDYKDASYTFTVAAGEPTRDGYRFLGWADSADATTPAYHAGDPVIVEKDAPYKTLYAVWEKLATDYSLTYDANGGVGVVPATQTATSTEDRVAFTIPAGEPTREGYTFKGWGITQDQISTGYYAGDRVDVFAVNPNRTLYAVWRKIPNDYSVTYNANGENVTGVPETEWVRGRQEDSYMIGLSGTPSRPGYTFKGWGASADSTTPITSVTATKDNPNVTVYAIWEKIPTYDYTLTYDGNGEKVLGVPGTESITGTTDESHTFTLSGRPVNNGGNYIFKGWAASADSTTPITSITATKDNPNVTVYAIWEEEVRYRYSLKYNANGEGVTGMPCMQILDNRKEQSEQYTLSTERPVRAGYTFRGWSASADSADLITTVTMTVDNPDVTVYAQWSANTYTLALDAGDGKTEKVAVTYNQPIGELPTPTKDGYTFEGWYDADGNKIVSGLIYTTPGDTTLTAKWTAKPTNPNTGDNTPVALYVTLMLFSVGALAAVTVCSKKRYFG